MEYSLARQEDLEELLVLRAKVLLVVNRLPADTDMEHIKQATADYYARYLEKTGDHITVVARPRPGAPLVACGSVCIYNLMPTYGNPGGKTAYLMNIFTEDEYRRQGVGCEIVNRLVEHAKQKGCLRILLETTQEGRPLYEACGFIPAPDEMQFDFENKQ